MANLLFSIQFIFRGFQASQMIEACVDESWSLNSANLNVGDKKVGRKYVSG